MDHGIHEGRDRAEVGDEGRCELSGVIGVM